MTAFEKIYEQVKKIPEGKVATYGQIAVLSGNPRWARVVGYALHANPDQNTIPCHRVVNRFGQLCEGYVFGGIYSQADRLKSEGVEISPDNRVDLEKYLWNGL